MICEYKVIVKGRKNACYAFLATMPCLEDLWIIDEDGSDESYAIIFEGECNWGVDMFSRPWEDECPVFLPDDADEAAQEAEGNYWFYSVCDRSRMFAVEVMCNHACIYDFGEDDCGIFEEQYEHYLCGKNVSGKCPDELLIDVGEWI